MANHRASQWLPPILRRILNRCVAGAILYRGPYATWMEASNASRGYESEDILTRVKQASSMVLEGSAEYEQDGSVFHDVPPATHAMAAILLGAAAEQGRLRVLDFGGGLGSHFLRWRRWLEALPEVSWCVVEQAHFAKEGAQLLAGIPAVSFATSIEETKGFAPTVVLASGVLQFLSDPMAALSDLSALNPRLIVIDRTPFSRDGTVQILTQHVPKSLGVASYPLRVLSRSTLHDVLAERYRLLSEFPSNDAPITAGRIRADYTGCIWLRRD